MAVFDIILIIILGGFVLYGFFFGFIRVVGMLAAVLAGAWVATHFYLTLFGWISRFWPGNPQVGKAVCFVICFSLVTHAVGWLFALFDQAFTVAAIIPFLKTINRLLGAAFGLVEGALAFGLAFYISGKYLPQDLLLAQWLKGSKLAELLINFSKILAPLLPEIYKQVKSLL